VLFLLYSYNHETCNIFEVNIMKKFLISALLGLLITIASKPAETQAQLVWTEFTEDEGLPEGIRLFRGTRINPAKSVWYLEVDMNNKNHIVHPYLSSTYRTTTSFTAHVGAIAAINGGYFSATSSVSTLVEPGELKSRNIGFLNREINGVSQTIPITRGFLALHEDRTATIDWLWHFNNDLDGMYWYENPTPNSPTNAAPTPTRDEGFPYEQLLMGIGGGPVLVKDGKVRVTYDEEGFFGPSGVDGFSGRSRTAVGVTADNRLIMLVADQPVRVQGFWSEGYRLAELAQLMIDLGCVEALNLDGGGSSTMAVGSKLINRPKGQTTQRAVPTILAVTHIDSLRLPPPPREEVIIDTEDEGVTITGDGWFRTANFGDSYGGSSSPSWLVPPGDGSQYIEYLAKLRNARYEVFGWWSASANRVGDAPYSITHAEGTSVVRVNQKVNNARWISLGEFEFTGTESDKVVISNNATGGDFVVADAIRFVQMSDAVVSVYPTEELPTSTRLYQNYPNPFNPTTTISFDLTEMASVSVKVYDLTGRLVITAYQGQLSSGHHRIHFDASALGSGTYIYRLLTDNFSEVRLMTLIK
jgi:hypothetical protein